MAFSLTDLPASLRRLSLNQNPSSRSLESHPSHVGDPLEGPEYSEIPGEEAAVLNDDDVRVTQCADQESDYYGFFYCGRNLGVERIPDSDGHCGPKDGPQCPSCRRFQRDSNRRLVTSFGPSLGWPKYPLPLPKDPRGETTETLFRKIRRLTALWTLVHFATILPPLYFGGTYPRLVLALAGAVFFVGFFVKHKLIVYIVETHMAKDGPGERWRYPPEEIMLGPFVASGRTYFGMPYWIANSLMNGPAIPDMTLFAGTVSEGLKRFPRAEQRVLWELGWDSAASVIGNSTSSIFADGLVAIGDHVPGASLGCILGFAIAVQLVYVAVLSLIVGLGFVEHPGGVAAQAFQILSLVGVSDVLERVDMDFDTAKKPRHGLFFAKVFIQQTPQTWISISLLGITWASISLNTRVMLLSSVILSLYTGATNASSYVWRLKSFLVDAPEDCAERASFVGKLCAMCCGIICLTISAANACRLFGVFWCPTGVLNLSSGCVGAQ